MRVMLSPPSTFGLGLRVRGGDRRTGGLGLKVRGGEMSRLDILLWKHLKAEKLVFPERDFSSFFLVGMRCLLGGGFRSTRGNLDKNHRGR